jgi:ATP/maltotriose-dependent transcriptional regulator MalT
VTLTAVERGTRAVERLAARWGLDLHPAVCTEFARAVIKSQESVCGLPVLVEGVRLTGKPLEVLDLMAAGVGTQEMAARMGVSVSTVKTHISRLFQVLGVRDRGQAVARGYDLGLLQVGASRREAMVGRAA